MSVKITVQLVSGDQFDVKVNPLLSNHFLYREVWRALPEEIRAIVPAEVCGMTLFLDDEYLPPAQNGSATISQEIYHVFLDPREYYIEVDDVSPNEWDIFLESSDGDREILGTLTFNANTGNYLLAGVDEPRLTTETIIDHLMEQTDAMGPSLSSKSYIGACLKAEIDQIRSFIGV